jgi:hypothetical protein
VACRKEKSDFITCVEVHHLLDGGVRRGHAFTVGLCPWHHRGVIHIFNPPDVYERNPDENRIAKMNIKYGPSLYHDAHSFHALYGSDDELLAFQNELLAREDGRVE